MVQAKTAVICTYVIVVMVCWVPVMDIAIRNNVTIAISPMEMDVQVFVSMRLLHVASDYLQMPV